MFIGYLWSSFFALLLGCACLGFLATDLYGQIHSKISKEKTVLVSGADNQQSSLSFVVAVSVVPTESEVLPPVSQTVAVLQFMSDTLTPLPEYFYSYRQRPPPCTGLYL
jgi:hypothetical protein